MTMKKHTIQCPKCKSTFDISGYINYFEKEFIKEIEKIVEKLRNPHIKILKIKNKKSQRT